MAPHVSVVSGVLTTLWEEKLEEKGRKGECLLDLDQTAFSLLLVAVCGGILARKTFAKFKWRS